MKKSGGSRSILLIACIVIIIVVLFLNLQNNDDSPNAITGFVNIDDFHMHKISLNSDIEQSISFPISFSTGEGRLSSLSLSGSIRGYGSVVIYLDNGNQKKLIYSNLKKKGLGYRKMAAVTGMAVKQVDEHTSIGSAEPVSYYEPVPEGYMALDGDFKSRCIDTCAIPAEFIRHDYDIEVLVEPGTQLFLDELTYTISDEIGK